MPGNLSARWVCLDGAGSGSKPPDLIYHLR